ncbi:hypothetical protein SNEBB_001594 [Seison nebaliae]|nr:hypothetical protein SNEBB_001594 [Seison nebaliae]
MELATFSRILQSLNEWKEDRSMVEILCSLEIVTNRLPELPSNYEKNLLCSVYPSIYFRCFFIMALEEKERNLRQQMLLIVGKYLSLVFDKLSKMDQESMKGIMKDQLEDVLIFQLNEVSNWRQLVDIKIFVMFFQFHRIHFSEVKREYLDKLYCSLLLICLTNGEQIFEEKNWDLELVNSMNVEDFHKKIYEKFCLNKMENDDGIAMNEIVGIYVMVIRQMSNHWRIREKEDVNRNDYLQIILKNLLEKSQINKKYYLLTVHLLNRVDVIGMEEEFLKFIQRGIQMQMSDGCRNELFILVSKHIDNISEFIKKNSYDFINKRLFSVLLPTIATGEIWSNIDNWKDGIKWKKRKLVEESICNLSSIFSIIQYGIGECLTPECDNLPTYIKLLLSSTFLRFICNQIIDENEEFGEHFLSLYQFVLFILSEFDVNIRPNNDDTDDHDVDYEKLFEIFSRHHFDMNNESLMKAFWNISEDHPNLMKMKFYQKLESDYF